MSCLFVCFYLSPTRNQNKQTSKLNVAIGNNGRNDHQDYTLLTVERQMIPIMDQGLGVGMPVSFCHRNRSITAPTTNGFPQLRIAEIAISHLWVLESLVLPYCLLAVRFWHKFYFSCLLILLACRFPCRSLQCRSVISQFRVLSPRPSISLS